MKDLSIVIVNWNGGTLLQKCLASIRASRHDLDVEVLIVDNHSADGSREAASEAFPEYRVVDSGSNLGFGRGNNVARRLTGGRYVLFLNPDTELRPDTLDMVTRCMAEHPDVGAMGCRMLYPDGSVQELGLQWTTTPSTVLAELLLITAQSRQRLRRWLPTVDPLRSGHVRKLYGGFFMVRRDVMDSAGWFDERYFMYAEDADLSRTIRGMGWKLYYCSEAAIVHVTGGVTAEAPSSFSILMKLESVNKMIAKYDGRFAAVRHRAAVLAGGAVRFAASAARRVRAAFGNADRRARADASFATHRLMVLWALGLRRAATPARPREGLGGDAAA